MDRFFPKNGGILELLEEILPEEDGRATDSDDSQVDDAARRYVLQLNQGESPEGTKQPSGLDITEVAWVLLSKRDELGVVEDDHAIMLEIEHAMADGTVTRYSLFGRPDRLAGLDDFGVAVMAITHVTEAMNRFRAGKCVKPGPEYIPNSMDIQSFCPGLTTGDPIANIAASCERLIDTPILVSQVRKSGSGAEAETTIRKSGGPLLWRCRSPLGAEGRLEDIEITLSDWIYKEIVEGNIRIVSPDSPN